MKKGIAIIIFFALFMAALSLYLPAKLGCRIAGIVVDKETGEPVSGAKIYIRQRERYSYCLTWQSRFNLITDDFGRFTQLLHHNGAYLVYCQMDGYIMFNPDNYSYMDSQGLPMKDKVFDVAEGEVKFLRIELERGGTIRGTFKVNYGGKILPLKLEANLYTKLPGTGGKTSLDENVIDLHIDASGYGEASNIKAGDNYCVWLDIDDGYPLTMIDNVVISENEITDISRTIDIYLENGVSGRVSLNGHIPKEGAVYLDKEESKKNSPNVRGYFILKKNSRDFRFVGFPPGKYKISASVTGKFGDRVLIEDFVEIKPGVIVKKNIANGPNSRFRSRLEYWR